MTLLRYSLNKREKSKASIGHEQEVHRIVHVKFTREEKICLLDVRNYECDKVFGTQHIRNVT